MTASCSNVTSDESSEGVVYWALNGYGVKAFDIIINIFIVIVGFAVVTLNALVLDTMVRLKKMKEPADLIVASLAIADLMTGILLFYQTTYNLSNYQILEECLIRFGILSGLIVTSTLHLGVLTLDRYVRIVAPYKYGSMCKMTFVVCVSALLWFLSTIFAFLPLLGWHQNPQDVSPDMARIDDEEECLVCAFFGVMHPDFIRTLVILYFIPFLVMGVLYLHIFKIARRHARAIAVQGNPAYTKRDRHSWKYTKTVLIVMGAYFFCWLPVGVVLIMSVVGSLHSYTLVEQGTFLLYASATAYVNSMINPIIYAFKISAVHARFKLVFCCKQVEDEDHITWSVNNTQCH